MQIPPISTFLALTCSLICHIQKNHFSFLTKTFILFNFNFSDLIQFLKSSLYVKLVLKFDFFIILLSDFQGLLLKSV